MTPVDVAREQRVNSTYYLMVYTIRKKKNKKMKEKVNFIGRSYRNYDVLTFQTLSKQNLGIYF